MTTVVWFKRDLRIHDHAPLAHAAQRGAVIALYVYEPIVHQADIFDPSHLVFLNDCLASLRSDLAALGIPLTTRYGEVCVVLSQLHREHPFSALMSHEETGNAATYQRDIDVVRWCASNNIVWREWPQHGVIRRLKHRNGWASRWAQRMSADVIAAPTCLQAARDLPSIGLLDESALHLPTNTKRIQRGGRDAADRMLDSFLQTRSHHYQKEMSAPYTAWTSCSRLSTYLALGVLSLKEVTQRCARMQAELAARKASGEPLPPLWAKSLQSFQARLHWHCHFMQKLEDEPAIEFENFARGFDGMRPLFGEANFPHEHYAAWCEGRTGYPMVDACMRALLQTGWLNFRMRAMLVSFAAYQLWIDWRPLAKHLAKHFLDYEPGIHYSQHQMQSGTTGINTPRMYSAIKQAQENDPQGLFIRRYVPELANVPLEHLAQPHLMSEHEQRASGCIIGVNYPLPIVDHALAFREARAKLAVYRRDSAVQREADAVQEKHGSRKSGLKPMMKSAKKTSRKKQQPQPQQGLFD